MTQDGPYSGHWELEELDELGAVHFFRLTDEVSTKIQMSKGPTLHTVEQLVV